MKPLFIAALTLCMLFSGAALAESPEDCGKQPPVPGKIEGFYMGTACPGEMCITSIRLDNGTEVDLVCGDDTARSLFGEKTRSRVVVEYEKSEYWFEPAASCATDLFCTGGRVLAKPGAAVPFLVISSSPTHKQTRTNYFTANLPEDWEVGEEGDHTNILSPYYVYFLGITIRPAKNALPEELLTLDSGVRKDSIRRLPGGNGYLFLQGEGDFEDRGWAFRTKNGLLCIMTTHGDYSGLQAILAGLKAADGHPDLQRAFETANAPAVRFWLNHDLE